jgi:uncharacterized protein (UPF0276 family)
MSQPENSALASIPVLGSGLGYRRELRAVIFEHAGAIDFLEIVTEQFTEDAADRAELEEICTRFPVIPHGIGLSVGSDRLDPAYLAAIKRISDRTGAPYYSEHLAMTRVPGIEVGHLSPLWYTEHVLRATTENVFRVQDALGKPLILENITYPFDIRHAGMGQAEFFTRLVDVTGCGVLLDVTNLYINATNHHFDAVAFLYGMPLDHIVQVHLAGGFAHEGVAIDSHSRPVEEGSWRLLDALAALTTVKCSILEHDANYPETPVLLDQLGRARRAISRRASAQ